MRNYKDHLIPTGSKIRSALIKLNSLGSDAILFVVDTTDTLIGSITDGDVRRALIEDYTTDDVVDKIIQDNPKFIEKDNYDIFKVIEYRKGKFRIIPIVDKNGRIVNVINFDYLKSYLPLDAILMAGGRGSRLSPMTDTIPKPLLKIGDKAIMEHNVDRLALFGIDDFWFSINYLGEQIEEYFGTGENKNRCIEYVEEEKPLGTFGAIANIDSLRHEYVLITNSDILTNMDYEDFFINFLKEKADMSIVSIPYEVDIPYAVLETQNNVIKDFKEKPTYTYYSNGGIYLVKKELLVRIPRNTFYNATDLLDSLIKDGKKIISYPISDYWLDIGKPADFEKAQRDINQIKF